VAVLSHGPLRGLPYRKKSGNDRGTLKRGRPKSSFFMPAVRGGRFTTPCHHPGALNVEGGTEGRPPRSTRARTQENPEILGARDCEWAQLGCAGVSSYACYLNPGAGKDWPSNLRHTGTTRDDKHTSESTGYLAREEVRVWRSGSSLMGQHITATPTSLLSGTSRGDLPGAGGGGLRPDRNLRKPRLKVNDCGHFLFVCVAGSILGGKKDERPPTNWGVGKHRFASQGGWDFRPCIIK